MASLFSINLSVSAPLQVVTTLAKCAKNLGQLTTVNGQDVWTTNNRIGVEVAYQLMADLVQAAGPTLNNNQHGMNTANSYMPAVSNNNPNNLFARNQPMNESQLLLAAADALAPAIANVIMAAMAIPQNLHFAVLPSNYQWPDLPVKYFVPFDKRTFENKNRNLVCLFGRRTIKLPPTRSLILEQLLAVPENTLIPQQRLINNVYGLRGLTSETVWHAHMSYLRSAIAPELMLETERGVGYRIRINKAYLAMPGQQRMAMPVTPELVADASMEEAF